MPTIEDELRRLMDGHSAGDHPSAGRRDAVQRRIVRHRRRRMAVTAGTVAVVLMVGALALAELRRPEPRLPANTPATLLPTYDLGGKLVASAHGELPRDRTEPGRGAEEAPADRGAFAVGAYVPVPFDEYAIPPRPFTAPTVLGSPREGSASHCSRSSVAPRPRRRIQMIGRQRLSRFTAGQPVSVTVVTQHVTGIDTWQVVLTGQ